MRHVVESRYLCATNSCLHTPEEKTNQGHLRTACTLLFLLAKLCSMCAAEAHIGPQPAPQAVKAYPVTI